MAGHLSSTGPYIQYHYQPFDMSPSLQSSLSPTIPTVPSVSPMSEEFRNARREIELLKTMDPFRAAEMALEIQVEKLHVQELITARAAVVARFVESCRSVKQKTAAIEKLTAEKTELEARLDRALGESGSETKLDDVKEIMRLETIMKDLRDEIQVLKSGNAANQRTDAPPLYEEDQILSEPSGLLSSHLSSLTLDMSSPQNSLPSPISPLSSFPSLAALPSPCMSPNLISFRSPSPSLTFKSTSFLPSPPYKTSSVTPTPADPNPDSNKKYQGRTIVQDSNDIDHKVSYTSAVLSPIPGQSPGPGLLLPPFQPPQPPLYIPAPPPPDPEDSIKARHATLATLPIPAGIPVELSPIIIPTPFTLHEFLGTTSGSLRNALSNYRVFQEPTTTWCPEREEHGYYLTPVYKCNTNPRMAHAHRWSEADVRARMAKPAECFFNKDGKWYYAGVYKAFRLADLTTKEWEGLSSETVQAIVKETLAGRKNTSPQNHYETGQLYACGALRVACIGLQCVGFNLPLYRTILEQANKCATSGRWKTSVAPAAAPNVQPAVMGWQTVSSSGSTDSVGVDDGGVDGEGKT